MNPRWKRVTKAHPCPVCGEPDWCGFAPDGTAVCCMRTPSDRELANGGWFHWVGPKPERPTRPLPPPSVAPEPPTLATDTIEAMFARWSQHTAPGDVVALASGLGVNPAALRHLGAAVYSPGVWAFPMRDAAGSKIGVRLRSGDGRKWAVPGSRAGLIYADQWRVSRQVLICEGPTDTAAAMSLGYAAVGRPSCRGQEDLIRELLQGYRGNIVILSDRDTPKTRPDGSVWFPGQEGAAHLAESLKRPLRIVTPPAKDIRAWACNGGSREAMDALIANARWQNVR